MNSVKVYRAEELMEILHIGRSMVYKLLQTGKIKSIRIGTMYRIPQQYLEDFLTMGYNSDSLLEGLPEEGRG